jgi:hypothetical protein
LVDDALTPVLTAIDWALAGNAIRLVKRAAAVAMVTNDVANLLLFIMINYLLLLSVHCV